MEVVPDDFSLIEDRLHHFVDDECYLVFTTGGTGMTPDDITPEATLIVNFPGSPQAVEQLFPVIAPVLRHAVATLRGESSHGHRHGG